MFHWKRISPPFPTLGNCLLGLQLCIHKFSSLDYTKNTYNLKVFILKELNNVPRLRDTVHIMKLLKLLIIFQGIWYCITKGRLQQVGLLGDRQVMLSGLNLVDMLFAFVTSYYTCLSLLSLLHVRSYQHTSCFSLLSLYSLVYSSQEVVLPIPQTQFAMSHFWYFKIHRKCRSLLSSYSHLLSPFLQFKDCKQFV